MKTSLVLFSLNEIEGMRVILPRIQRDWVDEIIVVDGHSTDGTVEYCREHGCIVHLQEDRGMENVLVETMKVAKGDVIIMFTPDGNSIPEKIPELISKVKGGNDLAIVSRYLPPAKSEDDDFITGFGNWMFTAMINVLFRSRLTDSLVGFFAFRRELFQELKLGPSDSWGVILTLRCLKKGKRVGEIAGSEPKRIGGVRKMQPLRNGFWVLRAIFKELLIGNRY